LSSATTRHRSVAVAYPGPEHLPRSVGRALLGKDKGSEERREGGSGGGKYTERRDIFLGEGGVIYDCLDSSYPPPPYL